MIAKAFAKKMDKKMENNEDALSVSFESASHDDAIGNNQHLSCPNVIQRQLSTSSWLASLDVHDVSPA